MEIWEDAITYELHKAGVVSQLVSDHPHLFETGGENYHVDFTAWAYERGHEGDPWKTRPDPSWAGAPIFGRDHMPYHDSRGWFRDESDFPGPRTMMAAARWIEENAGWHDRFFLFIDEFDPHEPFDTPEPWASMYDPDYEGPPMIWPPYMQGAVEKGVLSPAAARRLRASYGAKLSMIDTGWARSCRRLRTRIWRMTPWSWSAPTTGTTSARRTSGESPACPSTTPWVTSPS